jgi:hypothetical protein
MNSCIVKSIFKCSKYVAIRKRLNKKILANVFLFKCVDVFFSNIYSPFGWVGVANMNSSVNV